MASSDKLVLAGKVAIITGSCSGIGEGIALEFVRQGASVTLNGLELPLLDAVEKKCAEISGDKNKVLSIFGDITQEDIRKKLIEDTVKRFGKLDILVNNAGIFRGKPLAADFELNALDAMLNIHVRAPFHLIKLAIPHLIKTKGNIVNTSSVAALMCCGSVEYGIGKAALNHMTKFAALELGQYGIRANAINPGTIDTRILEKTDVDQTRLDNIVKNYPIGRKGNKEEVGKLVVYLASEAASFITGISVPIDGGRLLQYFRS